MAGANSAPSRQFAIPQVPSMPQAADAPTRAKRIPLRDFFRNPEQSRFQVSPDGNAIAFMQPYQTRMNVFVRPRAGGPAVRVTNETERDVAGYFWKGSRRIVFLKDFKGDENYHLVSVDADGGNLVDLTPFEKVRAQIIDDRYDARRRDDCRTEQAQCRSVRCLSGRPQQQTTHADRRKPRQRHRLGHRPCRTNPARDHHRRR